MAASVLAHAARRQGRQGLLAWRAAAAEAQAAPQLLQGAGQQGQGQGLPRQAAAAAELPQQQWAGTLRSLHTAAGPSSGIAAAAASNAASPAAVAAGLLTAPQSSSAALLWVAQQRRGMALNFSRYQPRRKPQEDRNLPEKNEEIRAKEVRGARHPTAAPGCMFVGGWNLPEKNGEIRAKEVGCVQAWDSGGVSAS